MFWIGTRFSKFKSIILQNVCWILKIQRWVKNELDRKPMPMDYNDFAKYHWSRNARTTMLYKRCRHLRISDLPCFWFILNWNHLFVIMMGVWGQGLRHTGVRSSSIGPCSSANFELVVAQSDFSTLARRTESLCINCNTSDHFLMLHWVLELEPFGQV